MPVNIYRTRFKKGGDNVKHLLPKKANKNRADVYLYGCGILCTDTCWIGCGGGCGGYCSFCETSCTAVCAEDCNNSCKTACATGCNHNCTGTAHK